MKLMELAERMLLAAVAGGVIGLLVYLAAWYYAMTKRWSDVIREKPSRLASFTVQGARDDIMRVVLRHALGQGHQVEHIDDQAGFLVTSDWLSFWKTRLMLYAVYLSDAGEGRVLVEVGAARPVPTRRRCLDVVRDRYATSLKAAVFLSR